MTITISKEEALVLECALQQLENSNQILQFEEAERRALYNFHNYLERELAELFALNYKELLEQARKSLVSE